MLKKLFSILSKHQKRKILILQIYIFIMAALEIITVLSISAFIYLMTNPNNINQNFFLREVLKITSLYSSGNSIGTLSILIFFIIVTSSITSFYANLSITRFSMHLGNSLIVNLFNFYLKKDYILN